MKITRQIKQGAVVLLGVFASACVTPANTAPSGKGSINSDNSNSVGSTTAIMQEEEKKYAQLLIDLQAKNAQHDAQQAIAQGDNHILGYQSGRGGLKTPGINSQQNRCSIKQLDGMGDTIFGENHLHYRIALRQYVNKYNLVMLPYCQ